MKKGSIGATILALLLVFIFIASIALLGFLWWRQTGNMPKNFPNFNPTSKKQDEQSDLRVISPANGTVFASDKTSVQVSGVARPNSVVVLTSTKLDKLVLTDSAGNFQLDNPLIKGVNFIRVTSFDGKGKKLEKTLAVFLSSPPDGSDTSASGSSSSLGIVKNENLFWGKVKGILKNNLTIASGGDTKEIATQGGTKFEFPERKSDPETDSLPDIQKVLVDNFAAAIGTATDNSLTAQKLIVYKSDPTPTSKISTGTVESIDTGEESLIFKDDSGTRIKVFWNKSSELLGINTKDFTKITVGSRIYQSATKNQFGNLIIGEAVTASSLPEQSSTPSAKK